MSIYREKSTGVIVQDSTKDMNKIYGKLVHGNCHHSIYSLLLNEAEPLYTESDLEEKVKELNGRISFVRQNARVWKKLYKEQEDRNKILCKEIEELKMKVPQPVEISRKLADVIEYFREEYEEYWGHYLLQARVDSNLSDYLTLQSFNFWDLIEAIKNGYTVKPEQTLRDKILDVLDASFAPFSSEVDKIIDVLKAERLIKDED